MSERPIPPKPEDHRNPSAWILWANRHFPFAADWQKWLTTRSESDRPRFGTYESLEDLRGIKDRGQAAMCAWLWWSILGSQERILGEHKKAQDNRRNVERQRLVKLAVQALDGKLGATNEDRDQARSTVQNMLGYNPERASDYDLADWAKMHAHQKELRRNPNAKAPRLWADIKREREQRRQLAEVNAAIDATPAGKPAMQKEMFG